MLGSLAAAWALFSFGHVDARKALAMIQGETTLAPLVFLATLVVSSLLVMPLGLGLNLGAGIIWGAVLGGALTTLGSLIAAVAGYIIGHYLGEPFVEKHLSSPPARKFMDIVRRNDWEVIFLVRLNPILPFGLQNYGFGLVGVPLVRYTVLSLFSCAIPSFLYAAIGASINELTLSRDLKGLLTLGGAGLMVVTVGYLAALYMRKSKAD